METTSQRVRPIDRTAWWGLFFCTDCGLQFAMMQTTPIQSGETVTTYCPGCDWRSRQVQLERLLTEDEIQCQLAVIEDRHAVERAARGRMSRTEFWQRIRENRKVTGRH